MQRTYNLNKNVTKLRMRAKASSRQVADFLIWFLRLNKQQYFAELISSLVRFSYHADGVWKALERQMILIWKPISASAIFYSAEFDLLLGILISMIYVSAFLSRVLIFPGPFINHGL